MIARALLVACIILGASPFARAVTVDDFFVGFPSPPGTLNSCIPGLDEVTQPGFVFPAPHWSRNTRASRYGAECVYASIFPNPSPPPLKRVLNVAGGGGDVRLGYEIIQGYDVTLGGTGNFPSSVAVLSTQMLAGGTVELTLSDGGSAATRSVPTVGFSSFGSPSGTTKYSFYPNAASFPGVNLTNIRELAVRVTHPTATDIELSEIRIDPVGSKFTSWARGYAFEPVAAPLVFVPRVLVGFGADQPPEPVFPTLLDLSDPLRPRITWQGAAPPADGFDLSVGSYWGFGGIVPCVNPGDQFEIELMGADGAPYRMVLQITSSDGQVLDPGSLVGFNPQPEPPAASLYAWAGGQPPDPGRVGFGLTLGLQAPPGVAPAGVGDPSVTLSFQILDPAGTPIPLAQALPFGIGIPALPFWAALALVTLLAALLALHRPARAQRSSEGSPW